MADDPDADAASRARRRFDDAYDDLAAAMEADAAIDREAADFATLTANHAALTARRSEMVKAKRGVVSRVDYEAPGYVEQPLGHQDISVFGRVAAAASALLLGVAVVAFWFSVRGGPGPITAELVSETVVEDGTRCLITFEMTVTNTSDLEYGYTRVILIANRQRIRMAPTEMFTLEPGVERRLQVRAPVRMSEPCTPEDVTRSGIDLEWQSVSPGTSAAKVFSDVAE